MDQNLIQDNLHKILNERFGLKDFRLGQLGILSTTIQGRDAMAVMPTGGGKSICYQIPSMYHKGIVIVVSPLIALMKDQVDGLKKIGVAAGCLHSGQSMAQKREVFASMAENEHFILYLSPERVQKEGFAHWIKRQKISLFAIDEAHCVSQWGPDFRKDYYRLSLLRDLRPDVPILALTATATPEVLLDIQKTLKLRRPERHVYGFYRPNLYYQVEACDDDATKMRLLKQAIKQTPQGRIIIYCGTRKQCEEVSLELKDQFPETDFYHAGMGQKERARIQEAYATGEVRILAATNAFGMGIDHPDVRLVVHFQMPSNIESFYQEMGRAGRDGKDATCLLLYSKRDKGLHAYFITQSEGSAFYINRKWRALETITQFAESGECRHAGILTYFKDSFRLKACNHCDVCDPGSERRVQRPLSLPIFSKIAGRKKKPKQASASTDALTSEQEVRMDVLRQWRREYAQSHDVPAFLIFSDRTLRDLARMSPRNIEDLHAIYGLGPQKIERFGSLLIDELGKCGGK